MASAQRVTVLESLRPIFHELENSLHEDLQDIDFIKQRLLRRLNEIKDVAERYRSFARFYSVCRDFKNYEEAVRNLYGNNFPEIAAIAEYDNSITNGYGSEAVKSFNQILKLNATPSWVMLFKGLFLIGQFPLLGKGINQVKDKYQIQDPGLEMHEFIRGVDVARSLGLTEERMAGMYDVFGQLMRAEGIRWQTNTPNVRIFDLDQGGPSILLQFNIHRNAVVTADLNKRIALEIARNNLVTPGVSFRVKPEIKMTEEEQQAILAEL